MIEKVNDNEIKIKGRIDSNNAKEFEDKLLAAAEGFSAVTLDASELEYISSAGLRVLLKLKKTIKGNVKVTETSKDIYDIFEVTGFTNLLDVEKRLREVSVEGCEVVGEGANGKVYRLDPETIIKVFAPGVSMDVVKEERDFAQAAFVAGVPTAISYDVVRCGDSYGAIYEMLDAKTVSAVIKNNPERAEELGTRLGRLLKELHSTSAEGADLENMQAIYSERVEQMRKYLNDEEIAKLKSIYDVLPQKNTVLHGDFHAKNVMLMDDELVFIDMGDVGYGHPLLDMGSTFLGMVNIGRGNPDIVEHYIGMNYELCLKTWDALMLEYFGAENVEEGKKLAEIYGLAKYALTPTFYTKMTEEMAHGLVTRNRANGILSKDFDITPALEPKIQF